MSNRPQYFDEYAAIYDDDFTYSNTGMLQRAQVWRAFNALNLPPQTVLEINCGTGEDAILLAQAGHTVTATDASDSMVLQAQRKAESKQVAATFIPAAFSELRTKVTGATYDLVFSNFGGLNCVGITELQQLSADLAALLKPGGQLFFVLMGNNCRWEQLYFLLKGDKQKAFRRKAAEGVPTTIGKAHFTTYFYSPAQFANLFAANFTVEKIGPVGLFVPPSYLDPFFKKHPLLLKTLNWLDKLVAKCSLAANQADHYVLVLKKKSN